MMFKVDAYTKKDSRNRVRQEFAGSIKTDGSGVSIMIHKRIDPKPVSYCLYNNLLKKYLSFIFQ